MNNDIISRSTVMKLIDEFGYINCHDGKDFKANNRVDRIRQKVIELPAAYVPEQEKIINKVLEERKRQDAKWGEQNHIAPVWGMIIGEEYGEMCKAINEFGFNPTPEKEQDIYTEAIHTMASCMAMIECIERQRKQEGVED